VAKLPWRTAAGDLALKRRDNSWGRAAGRRKKVVGEVEWKDVGGQPYTASLHRIPTSYPYTRIIMVTSYPSHTLLDGKTTLD
jgi:hypothetical protein